MESNIKNGAYYKKKISDQGRSITWVAKQMGFTRTWMSQKLNGLNGLELTEKEMLKLDKILSL